MIRTVLYNPKTDKTIFGDEKLFSEWLHNTELWIWADFDNEEQEHERTLFKTIFDLHTLAISDAQHDQHPPKLEAFDKHFFLLVTGLNKTSNGIDFGTLPISFFTGDRFLITRRALESVSIDLIWSQTKKGKIKLSSGIAHITYLILLQITDRYTSFVLKLEKRLEEMEDDMFENPRDALLGDLLSYGRTLKRLRRIFEYHQYLFKSLGREDNSFLKIKDLHEFNDLLEHTERLTSLTILYKELTDDLMSGYISITGHRLNQIMKILTVVTVIFMPLTLIAGIYGMNFEYIPELKKKDGYFMLLGFMSFVVFGLLIVFRKVKWI
jgi:magnesium transporter